MRKFLLFSLLSFGALAWGAPKTIKSFTPQNLSEPVNQIRVDFSAPVVDLSVSPQAEVFDIACTPSLRGRANWEGTSTWTYDFETKIVGNMVPGGSKCQVSLKADFKKRKNITGKTDFQFQIDGPNILAIYPGDPGGSAQYTVVEDQVFLIGLDAPVDSASVKKHLQFKIEGIASLTDVRLLEESKKRAILKANKYISEDFKGLEVLAVQPKKNFPPDKKVSLIWGKGIRSQESGLERQRDLVLNYTSRPTLNAQFSCVRENAKADCSPFSEMELIFSAEIPADKARKIRLIGTDEKGREVVIPAIINPDEKGEPRVSRVTFRPGVKEKMTYRLEIPSGIKDDSGRKLVNESSFPMTVKTAEFPPLMKFASDFGILESKVQPVLLPVTLRNIESQAERGGYVPNIIRGSSLLLSSGNFPEVVTWLKSLSKKSANWSARENSVFAGSKAKVSAFGVPMSKEGKIFEVLGIPLKTEGFHVVELQSRVLGESLIGQNKKMFVASGALVTNMVVHSKFGRESSLFWVTTLDSATPVVGAEVNVTNCDGQSVIKGVTDKNGIFHYRGELKKKLDLEACSRAQEPSVYDSGFFVVASKGKDFTFTHSSWTEGIEPFRFGNILDMNPMWSQNGILAHTVLDRTLLRAGETVGMKHFLRVPSGQGFKYADDTQRPNVMQVTHADSGIMQTFPLQWDASGTAVSEFQIPKDSKLGTYQVSLARKNGQEISNNLYTATFQVMEFKVPLMKGTIAFPQKTQALVNPTKIEAQVSVNYQDGGPAANEPVRFSYRINKRWGLHFDDYGWDYGFAKEQVKAKEERTSDIEDTEVKTVEMPLRLNNKGSATVSIDNLKASETVRDVEAQLEFTDKNSERQTVSRQLTIYPSTKLIAVSVNDAFRSPKEVRFRAVVVDLKGRPLTGETPKFEMFEQVTYTHKTRMVGGFYSSESFNRVKKVKDIACEGATDRSGYISCVAKAPESGNYIIQASVTDANGNSSYGSDYVYVRGSRRAWYPADNNDRMDVVAENKEYKTGDRATLNVQMPFPQATALVTVEREGVVEAFVKKIATDGNQAIDLEIKDSYSPNIYVSVLAVRGRVASPEATAVVDLGKPAFKLGMTQLRVNWQANALNVKVKPVKESYKPREEVAVDVFVRDPAGKPRAGAEFALAVVDEGLLTLAKNETWDLLRAMMGRRYLEVETATAAMQVVGKRHFGLKAKPIGGDGGQAPTRELFDTLVKWLPRVKTDVQGHATVKFNMKDSLSKFRIVAIAHEGVGSFGMGESAVVTEQDIQVIPSMGAVARQGDRYATEFTVRNQTKQTKILTVRGRVKFTFSDGRVETRDLKPREVKLGALDSSLLSLGDVDVPEGAVSAEYEVSVVNSKKQTEDRVRIAQEIKPSVEVRTYMAQMEPLSPQRKTVVGVELPANADPKQGGLKVNLLPSLASGLTTVKGEMIRYPFQSLEFLVSRAVATSDVKVWNEAMAKIPAHMDNEGFLMWYPGAATNSGSEILTAYVLSMANYAGFAVPEDLQNRMLNALTAYATGSSRLAREEKVSSSELYIRRVNVIEVLTRYKLAQPVWLTSLPHLAPEQIPISTLNDLLSIYANLPEAPERLERINSSIKALEARMTQTGTALKLTDTKACPWCILSSEDLDQAELILVIAKSPALIEKMGERLPLLVRGAVAMLQRGAWDLTCANALGTLAFKAFAAAFEKEPVSGQTEVKLANSAKSYSWDAAGFEKGGAINLGWPALGRQEVEITHKGRGAPWAIVSVDAAVPLSEKIEKHFRVEKSLSPVKPVYKKGDVVTVTLSIKPQTEMPFVSLIDPIPAGAKILGSGLDNESAQGPETEGWAWPDYQELAYDAYRASYRSVPVDGIRVIYRVQLNNSGTFKLPTTRVEAIYMPENFAELPNANVSVRP